MVLASVTCARCAGSFVDSPGCRYCPACKPTAIVAARWKSLRKSAAVRKLFVTLKFDEFRALVEDAGCYYCGSDLPVSGSGVDRVESRKHYSPDNVVACCGPCNKDKMRMSQQDWFAVIRDRVDRGAL